MEKSKAFNEAEKIAERIGGHIPERINVNFVDEKDRIRPIVAISAELYTQIIQELGFYKGQVKVYEQLLERSEENNSIDVLNPETVKREYRECLVEKMNKEILRIRALKLESQPDKRKEGIIEGLEKAKEIILKEN